MILLQVGLIVMLLLEVQFLIKQLKMSYSQLLIEDKKSYMNSEQKLDNLESNKTLRVSNPDRQKQQDIINQVETLIFQQTGNQDNFTKQYIQINHGQICTTYFLKGRRNQEVTFYLGHGFGGTSLMYFPIFTHFLEKGNIVIWEVRGMGIGLKIQYPEIEDERINQFYVQGLMKILDFYNHKKITFVSHSLSAYVTLRYLMQYPRDTRIVNAVLLSPIGLTAKENDYKNTISSPSLCANALVNSFGWKFRLTFKSPLRTILRCMKSSILKKSFSQFPLTQTELDIMVKLFEALIELPDGSEDIFFRYFLPRVLPRQGQSIEQLIEKAEIKNNIKIYYGGQSDWVDKSGASKLCRNFNNFKMQIFQDSGHMICLNSQLMKNVLREIQ